MHTIATCRRALPRHKLRALITLREFVGIRKRPALLERIGGDHMRIILRRNMRQRIEREPHPDRGISRQEKEMFAS